MPEILYEIITGLFSLLMDLIISFLVSSFFPGLWAGMRSSLIVHYRVLKDKKVQALQRAQFLPITNVEVIACGR